GFVVLQGQGREDVAETYRDLRERSLPLVLTTDVILHLCRAQFTETLRAIEERVFHRDLTELLRALLDDLDRSPLPADTAEWRSARALALGYVAVGLKALDDGASLPRDADGAAVAEALAAMRRAEGRAVPVRLLGRVEDFSAFRPEGHYVRSERLKGYY